MFCHVNDGCLVGGEQYLNHPAALTTAFLFHPPQPQTTYSTKHSTTQPNNLQTPLNFTMETVKVSLPSFSGSPLSITSLGLFLSKPQSANTSPSSRTPQTTFPSPCKVPAPSFQGGQQVRRQGQRRKHRHPRQRRKGCRRRQVRPDLPRHQG